MSDRFEYRLVDTVISGWRDPNTQVAEFIGMLNDLGAEGWEAVSDINLWNKGYSGVQRPGLLFKRRITDGDRRGD